MRSKKKSGNSFGNLRYFGQNERKRRTSRRFCKLRSMRENRHNKAPIACLTGQNNIIRLFCPFNKTFQVEDKGFYVLMLHPASLLKETVKRQKIFRVSVRDLLKRRDQCLLHVFYLYLGISYFGEIIGENGGDKGLPYILFGNLFGNLSSNNLGNRL